MGGLAIYLEARRRNAAAASLALAIAVVFFFSLRSKGGAPAPLCWDSPVEGRVCLDPNAASGVHGLVEKAGPVSLRWWADSAAAWRTSQFAAWIMRAMAASKNGALFKRPLPVVRCDIYVNHAYKVLYVRCPKVASTAILDYFTLCQGDGPKQAPWCLRKLPGALTPEQAADLWRDYFAFAFTRAPLARALSTYKFLAHHVVAQADGCRDFLSWDEFCADPAVLGRACRRKLECCIHGPSFMFHHTEQQAPCLTTQDGGWAVDFLGRVEHMEEDLSAIVAEVNARRPAGAAALALPRTAPERNGNAGCAERSYRTAFTRSNGSRAEYWVQVAPEQYCDKLQYFRGRHAHCLEGLARYYAADLALLQRPRQAEEQAQAQQQQQQEQREKEQQEEQEEEEQHEGGA